MIVDIPKNSDFSIHNIPFGIFSTTERSPRVGVAIGDQILDLVEVAKLGVFDFDTDVFSQSVLNDFISLGKAITTKVRTDVQSWLENDDSPLAGLAGLFVLQSEATMHMPVDVRDYTDFYSSIEHATNVGKLFRDPENALLPNWKHLPVGYHGRASSIVVSGTEVYRPKGQVKPGELDPVLKSSTRLDFELEMAFIIGKETSNGDSIPLGNTDDHIFGMVIFNDWSARDIQKWEYVPLGPFLGKSFASSISPWVVTLEALKPFATEGPTQNPEVLEYLQHDGNRNYDVNLEVSIIPNQGKEEVICQSNYKYMYWNMNQQLAHHTINGCNVNVGDMMASGTISGKDERSFGSLLEMSHGGKKPLQLKQDAQRTWVEDGDTIIMRAYAEKDGRRVGFGEVKGTILPSK